MQAPKPNSPSMDAALLAHAAGGQAIRKPELYIHSEREALARAQGFRTWGEKAEAQARETWAWWDRFMGGLILD